MKTLPKAEEIKDQIARKYGFDTWQFYMAFMRKTKVTDKKRDLVTDEVAKEYTKQVLDYVAENAKVRESTQECSCGCRFEYTTKVVDKESILKVKNELK